MGVQTEIDRINSNIQSTLSTIADTGVAVGTDSNALPAAAVALANEKAPKDHTHTKLRTVTLSAGAWVNNTQTVAVSGVLADSTKQAINVAPIGGQGVAYGSAGIECTTQGANSLTFICEAAPENNITVNISIQEAEV